MRGRNDGHVSVVGTDRGAARMARRGVGQGKAVGGLFKEQGGQDLLDPWPVVEWVNVARGYNL